MNGKLIGVAVKAQTCGHGTPDIFMRISKFVKWIQEVSGVVAV